MVDEREILKQYSYKATSNLVLEQERRRGKDRDTVGVSSLQVGSLPGRMGDKLNLSGEKSHELQQRLQKHRERTGAATHRFKRPRQDEVAAPNDLLATTADVDVVEVAEELEIGENGGAYVPSNAVSQRAYEALMAFITSKIGDQPYDLLRGAADETLALLKDKLLTELDRKKHIESILGPMNGDEFARLSLLGRQISDFDTHDADAHNENLVNVDDDVALDDIGVAVVYDADEDEDGGDDDSDDAADEVVDVEADVDNYTGASQSRKNVTETEQNNEDYKVDINEDESKPDSVNLDPRKIDAYWIQRELSQFYPDPHECHRIAENVLDILASSDDDHGCEHSLVKLLQFDKFEVLSMLLENRSTIVWGTKFARSANAEEKEKLRHEMENDDRGKLLLKVFFPEEVSLDVEKSEQIDTLDRSERPGQEKLSNREDNSSFRKGKPKFSLRTIDLEGLAFQKGGKLINVSNCELPNGSEHIVQRDYEEWHIPATRAANTNTEKATIAITDLPTWAQSSFPGTRHLNFVQSTVFPCTFESDENMLLCAPTGAGKTNVAMLAILRAIHNVAGQNTQSLSNGSVDLSSLKVVYVAPMKALVAEIVENLGKRLESQRLVVRELTGDISLSRRDVESTHVIVTTPEKWDIITRKSNEKSFTRLVKLLIVDEIHLLHDERGPVLEAIVARTLREAGFVAFGTRIIGLSATLPNYKDVAAFLRVNPLTGLFYFGAEHRPCPLQQSYVGITAKKALKRFRLMNEVTYDKVTAQLDGSNQTIVFVHSRKETASTAQFIIDKAINNEVIDKFLKPKSGSFEIIQSELPTVSGKNLSSLLEHGVAIHHAGMTRDDRHLVERLFEAGHIKVLVSTATLAWGVNLPAHAVVIKGTQVYSPEHGRWTQLSSMDVMQMMGRAGRPQFDTFGEGTIITTKADVLYYLSLLNNQLPIESQMISRLVDMVNAEVANGSVSTIVEGSEWLSFTYLYVRMLQNPILYGISVDEREAEPILERRRAELIHSAALELHNSGLIRYNKKSGELVATEIGKIAANFYVSYQSMALYMERMKECTSDIDLLRIFSSSGEFKHMRVRDEEKLELSRLSERVPIPLKESLNEPTAKVNVLLQAYISNLSLDGLALRADMVYITQSAARLSRALLYIALQLKDAALFDRCLTLSKCVSARQWSSQSPLHQFQKKLGKEVVRRIERKDYSFERYYDLNVSELGELLKNPKLGRTVHRLVHSLPRLEMDAQVRPLSRSLVEVELSLLPDFRYDNSIHRGGESFWIFVEDADSEHLLHVELFFLKSSLTNDEHVIQFILPLTNPLPPQYFVRCVSDRWIVPDTVLPISYRSLILPEKFMPHSMVDMKSLSVEQAFQALFCSVAADDSEEDKARNEALADAYNYFASCRSYLSPVQTQLFPTLFESDNDAVVATLPDSDRDACAELCLARLFWQNPTSVAIWVVGKGFRALEHTFRFIKNGIGNAMALKTGKFNSEKSEDMNLLRSPGSVVITTAEKWDVFSRRWREKRISKILKRIGLIILDDIHLLSEITGNGAALEIVSSRMRYLAADARESGGQPFRIVAFSNPISNAREIGHWLGCSPSSVFSFHPRDVCKEIKLDVIPCSFRSGIHESLAVTLGRPVYSALRKYIGDKKHQVLVYVGSRKISSGLAVEIATIISENSKVDKTFQIMIDDVSSDVPNFRNIGLRESASLGIGFVHDGLHDSDKELVRKLFKLKKLKMLISASRCAWENQGLDSRLVIIAGTECSAEGTVLTRRKEYSRSDMMKMIFGLRDVTSAVGKRIVVILTEPSWKDFYKTHCLEPLAVESQLTRWLPDHLNSEIANGVIESKQDAVDYLTWTFFYRRLPKNPNYYGMRGVSPNDISNHLSEIVERSLSDLETSKCVATEGENDISLGPLNLGIIASHYYLRHTTVELFASSISGNTKLNGILDIVSLASEFDCVAVRNGEAEILQEMGINARIGLDSPGGPPSYSSTHVKAHLLLQAQMGRETLPGQLGEDQKEVVRLSVHLLKAMVDVISSGGWLKPAIAAIELCQMLIQGVWDSDSALMQLPHIDRERASLLKEKFDVSDIFEFLDMEEAERVDALRGLSKQQVSEIAIACQQFPFVDDIEIEEISETMDKDGGRITKIVVSVQRTEEGKDKDSESSAKGKVPLVSAPRFPETREEGWWIIVGDESQNTVFTVKHISLKKEAMVKLEFVSPAKTGKHNLKIYLMSDSYIECDQEESFEISVSDTDENVEAGNKQSPDGNRDGILMNVDGPVHSEQT